MKRQNDNKHRKAKSKTTDHNNKNEAGETLTNCFSNLASILLRTNKIVLENLSNEKEVRVKALVDQGSQCRYL